MSSIQYLSGFQNHHSTESTPGALPKDQNSPQRHELNLYPEQINGSSFLAPRLTNLKTWFYRRHPSVSRNCRYERIEQTQFQSPPFGANPTPPDPLRWDPLPYEESQVDFIDGLTTFGGNGDIDAMTGLAVHLYACNQSMEKRCFTNADGELLIVPQEGKLKIQTELGWLEIEPGEIALIPRGITFRVELKTGKSRGYVCENYGAPFRLPDLGPIGANGLANARHFEAPVAAADKDEPCEFESIRKFQGHLWRGTIANSPFDVLAWHGNYCPYRYDLRKFNTINTVSFDHPDPSIFTVLTSPSDTPGMSNADFVIFPERWMVAENTFRPPYYHLNVMSEFMGLIHGTYDAKPGAGFSPGGASVHNCMSAHGPDKKAFDDASQAELSPQKQKDTLAFMVESRFPFKMTEQALKSPQRQEDYLECWDGL